MTYDDSPEPLCDLDTKPDKPKVGDIVLAYEWSFAETELPFTTGKVVAVFDSLAEDWGIHGESAWTQREINENAGYRGRWYVIVEDGDGEYNHGTMALASYEVKSIKQ